MSSVNNANPSAAAAVAAASTKKRHSDCYVVVTTTYPTTTGCYRGKGSWSDAELARDSDIEASKNTHETYEEACDAARAARYKSCYWDGRVDEDDDEDEPPFDSCELSDQEDNDNGERIEVMTQGEYRQLIANKKTLLDHARAQHQLETLLETEMNKIKAQQSGGRQVHYSYPERRPYDIPAELELVESQLGTDAFVVPEHASSIQSVMFRGGNSFGSFLQHPTDDHVLIRTLQACTSLQELHLHTDGFNDPITEKFLKLVLAQAPHLKDTLQVLVFQGFEINPFEIPFLEGFSALQRLDLPDAFSTEFWDGYGGGNGFSDEDEDLPYDKTLVACVEKLAHLVRLDLGKGDSESRRYLYEYSLSQNAIRKMDKLLRKRAKKGSSPGRAHRGVTFGESSQPPAAWTSEARGQAAKAHCLKRLSEKEDVPAPVRRLAEQQWKLCASCGKHDTGHGICCATCQRTYYCTAKCQKKHAARHAAACKESFA